MKQRKSLVARALAAVAGTTIAAVLATGGVASATITIGNETCDLTGAGTAASPYTVATAEQLQEVTDCNALGSSFYKVTGSFSIAPLLSGAPSWNSTENGGWKPIGDGGEFAGVFDGNGKTISGLTIDRLSNDYQALFGIVRNAAIFNLTISGTVKGNSNSGGLVGQLYDSSVQSITSSVAVTGKGQYVGGVIGNSTRGIIDDVTASGVVQVDNSSEVNSSRLGGIVGYASTSSLSNLRATGAVNGRRLVSEGVYSNYRYVGGVVGDASTTSLDTLSSTGAVSGDLYVGGIAGQQNDGHAAGFTSSSAVTGSSYYVGGLVGSIYYVSLADGTATGSVSGYGYVGGIAGYVDDSAALVRVKSTGAISSSNEYTGGIAGYLVGQIDSATATGAITTTDNYVGGIAGYAEDGAIKSSTATGAITTSGGEYAGGITSYLDNASVTKSSSTGSITVTSAGGFEYLGGIVGYLDDGAVTDSTTSGAIKCGSATLSAAKCYYFGGAVGYSDWGSLVNVKSTRSITIDSSTAVNGGSYYIGGLVGWTRYTGIRGSSSTGAISLKNGVDVGGLVGDTDQGTFIIKSYSSGSVTVSNQRADWQMAAGGLVGGMTKNLAIIQSYTTSNVTATGYANSVGALVGIQWENPTLLVVDSFARGNVSGSANVSGLVGLLTDASRTYALRLKNVYSTGTIAAPSKTKASGNGAVSSNVATISWTGADHFFEVGDTISVSGCSNTALNGTLLKVTSVNHGTNGDLSYTKTTDDVTDVTGCSVTGTGAKDSVAIADPKRAVSAKGVLFLNGSSTVTGATKKSAADLKKIATYTGAGFSSTKWGVSATKNGGFAYLK